MPATRFHVPPRCLIPLSSDEPLWEWDIATDAFYLSNGSRKSLNLQEPPRSMAEFYRLMPPEAATELSALRENVISGKTGSTMECGYLCNGMWVREYLMTLSRNSEGRATRVMGRLVAEPASSMDTGFQNASAAGGETGIWVLDARAGKIWRDKTCSDLLGLDASPAHPVSAEEGLLRVHPAEREALRRHYDLFCGSAFLGDCITDIARVQNAGGEYTPLVISASALERDAEGKAILVAGILAPGEPAKRLDMFGSDNRLFHALNSIGGGQWNWDAKNGAMYFCPRYLAMLGYGPEEGADFARLWEKRIHPDDLDKMLKARQQAIESPEHGDTFEFTYRIHSADGGWAWIFDRGFVTWRDARGHAGHMIGSITNITSVQAERDRLEELVRHDSLTGLRSRAFCNLEIEHIEQNDIRPVTVISLDITGLKMVNDNLGHATGDELLTKAASLLRGSLRSSDFIARVGGDEFLVLLPNCGAEKGKKILRKIEACFADYNAMPDHMPVFAACGVASADSTEERLPDIIARADAAMYRNKKTQRGEARAALKAWIKGATGREPDADERLADV